MHEQSETFQNLDGLWNLVYGQNTAVPGRVIPGTPSFPSPQAADPYAHARSHATSQQHFSGNEAPYNIQRTWERAAGQPDIRGFAPQGPIQGPPTPTGLEWQQGSLLPLIQMLMGQQQPPQAGPPQPQQGSFMQLLMQALQGRR